MGGPSIRRWSSKVTVGEGEPEFVLGTAQLGSDYGIGGRRSDAPHAEAPSVFLAAAHDLGVEVLDTAPAYGRAETLIGEAHAPSAFSRAKVGNFPAAISGSIKFQVISLSSINKTLRFIGTSAINAPDFGNTQSAPNSIKLVVRCVKKMDQDFANFN